MPETLVCQTCGAELPETLEGKFCPCCGHSVKGIETCLCPRCRGEIRKLFDMPKTWWRGEIR